jgi:hypothetical protein
LPSRSGRSFKRSHELALRLGATAAYEDFLRIIDAEFERFEERALVDQREYSMLDSTAVVLAALVGRTPAAVEHSSSTPLAANQSRRIDA